MPDLKNRFQTFKKRYFSIVGVSLLILLAVLVVLLNVGCLAVLCLVFGLVVLILLHNNISFFRLQDNYLQKSTDLL